MSDRRRRKLTDERVAAIRAARLEGKSFQKIANEFDVNIAHIWRIINGLSWKMEQSTEERFWAKVDKNGPIPRGFPELGPCWVWIGSELSGRPSFTVEGKPVVAARYVKSLSSDVPDNSEVHHKCEVPSCVNPSHLEVVLREEHQLRHRMGPLTGAFGLSAREIQIIKLVCDGKSCTEMADEIGLARPTVETHMNNIRKKTGCGKTALLVRYAIREGISIA